MRFRVCVRVSDADAAPAELNELTEPLLFRPASRDVQPYIRQQCDCIDEHRHTLTRDEMPDEDDSPPAPAILADAFDYVAGTSTGAIIATCISLGMRVDEIRAFYEASGEEMFDKASLRQRFRTRFKDERLAAKLRSVIGEETTLCSENLRTLLMMVMRNATTDSPWPLSNNPDGQIRYFLSLNEASPSLKAKLNDALDIKGGWDNALRELNQVQADLNRLHQDQDRIRKNLANTPKEAEVYKTYLSKLNDQEKEIDALTAKQKKLMGYEFAARKKF